MKHKRLARIRGIRVERAAKKLLITAWCVAIPFTFFLVDRLNQIPKVPEI